MGKLNKLYILISSFIIILYFLVHTMIIFGFLPLTYSVSIFNYISVTLFSIPASLFVKNYVNKIKASTNLNYYAKSLNEVLIHQSHNQLFYDGDTDGGSKLLTKEVVYSLNVDRCGIWLFNDEKNTLNCQQLYLKENDKWYYGFEINKKDYEPFFNSIMVNQTIVANNAINDSSTKCFKEEYLKPFKINSMLIVPIYYKGIIIGLINIESYKLKEWHKVEVNFSEMLSSLYALLYSVNENKMVEDNLKNFEGFVNQTALVSRTDKHGNINYVNKRFCEVCGFTKRELMNKNHNILSSGSHKKEFWDKMYKITVTDKKIFHDLIINKKKNGEIYYTDTYIKADFDSFGELIGFTSIKQDVTELHTSLNELKKKNTYLEHAAKIIRHDINSGIMTYIPRGVSSLERRLNAEIIKNYKLDIPLKILKEGLTHTQKVYKGVYEFTNLVKKDSVLTKDYLDLKIILSSFLKSTAYSSYVKISELGSFEVNESLFCTAIDNLIRNGLKYNDSNSKIVKIYLEDEETLIVEDNGRGLSQKQFEIYSKPYSRDKSQKESGTGLGLNICIAILNEHGFNISVEKIRTGTKIKIKLN